MVMVLKAIVLSVALTTPGGRVRIVRIVQRVQPRLVQRVMRDARQQLHIPEPQIIHPPLQQRRRRLKLSSAKTLRKLRDAHFRLRRRPFAIRRHRGEIIRRLRQHRFCQRRELFIRGGGDFLFQFRHPRLTLLPAIQFAWRSQRDEKQSSRPGPWASASAGCGC